MSSRKYKNTTATLTALVGIALIGWVIAGVLTAQHYGTVGAPALSTSNIAAGGGKLFEVRFDPETYVGDLLARNVGTDGTFTADVVSNGVIETFNGNWRARDTVLAQSKRTGGSETDDRIIFTSASTGVVLNWASAGRIFNWDHENGGLTPGLKALVDPTADPEVTTAVSSVVNWNRGWDTNEGSGETDARERSYVLQNIVHSSPQYVPEPLITRYESVDNDYGAFAASYAGRAPMVYVNSHSSMLHGFRASNGDEIFAFIPHTLLSGLPNLMAQGYSEIFTGDGTPTVADAHGEFPGCVADSCWQTVLVSGLGAGGNSIFALNVTDPVNDAVSELSAASSMLLWEFTDEDLGDTTARPVIARLQDETWVAIFGNGQGSGGTFLYVVDIASGTLIQKLELDSTVSTGGLSSPAVWNTDFDAKETIEIVYAGDIDGNLWKFDFSGADKDGGVVCAFDDHVDSVAPCDIPLVSVSDPGTNNPLPITTQPLISINPAGGLFVYFGTGINGQDSDDSNGMFGIKDTGSSLGSDPALVVHKTEQFLHGEPAMQFRFINLTTSPLDPVGWKLELPTGERILNDPILNNKRVSFTSTDPIVATFNENWLNGVHFETGNAPDTPFLDIDGDNDFDADDYYVDPDDDSYIRTPMSRFLDVGVVSGPTPANIANSTDTVFITHGYETAFVETEDEGGFVNPFNDPGARGGHFDMDVYDHEAFVRVTGTPTSADFDNKVDGEPSEYCFDLGSCHQHEYDDQWNIDGVNPLNHSSVFTDPPDVETANGILDYTYRSFYQAIQNEVDGVKMKADGKHIIRTYDTSLGADNDGTELTLNGVNGGTPAPSDLVDLTPGTGDGDLIYMWVRNPNSVDTQANADLRLAAEIGNGVPAPPVTVIFQCATNYDPSYLSPDGKGQRYKLYAPDFNNLSHAARRCRTDEILEMRLKVTHLFALRATKPDCVRGFNLTLTPTASLGDPNATYPNTSYRNGAIALQVVRERGDPVRNAYYSTLDNRHESADNINFSYHAFNGHANGSRLTDAGQPLWADGDYSEFGTVIMETSVYHHAPNAWCDLSPENERHLLDPASFTGADPADPEEGGGGGGGSSISIGSGGKTFTEGVEVDPSLVSSGRYSWREVLQ
jgi:hypothetical protein